MAWFGRRKSTAPEQAATRIDAFWSWWRDGGEREASAAVERHDMQALHDLVTPHVDAVHPDLAWEYCASTPTPHRLTVTAEGDPRLVPVARQWVEAAPPPSGLWSYGDKRPRGSLDSAVPTPHGPIRVRDLTIAVRPGPRGFHLIAHHPHFALLPEADSRQIAALLVGVLLGEEGMEFVEALTTSTTEPEGAVDAAEVPSVAAELARRMAAR